MEYTRPVDTLVWIDLINTGSHSDQNTFGKYQISKGLKCSAQSVNIVIPMRKFHYVLPFQPIKRKKTRRQAYCTCTCNMFSFSIIPRWFDKVPYRNILHFPVLNRWLSLWFGVYLMLSWDFTRAFHELQCILELFFEERFENTWPDIRQMSRTDWKLDYIFCSVRSNLVSILVNDSIVRY